MKNDRRVLQFGRTAGERVFDRAFVPLVAFWVFSITTNFAAFRPGGGESVQVWPPWIAFAIGSILAALWGRALVTLLLVWNDPSAKVVRFSALVLLIPFGAVVFRVFSGALL